LKVAQCIQVTSLDSSHHYCVGEIYLM